jgi:hypothetical protein
VDALEVILTLGFVATLCFGFAAFSYRFLTSRMSWGPSPQQGDGPPQTPRPSLSQRVVYLEHQLASACDEVENWARLFTSATAEAEKWKKRAVIAEARVAELAAAPRPAQLTPDHRFQQLRTLLARELHPDHTKSEGIERIIRTELFKGLWPQVQKIEQTAER